MHNEYTFRQRKVFAKKQHVSSAFCGLLHKTIFQQKNSICWYFWSSTKNVWSQTKNFGSPTKSVGSSYRQLENVLSPSEIRSFSRFSWALREMSRQGSMKTMEIQQFFVRLLHLPLFFAHFGTLGQESWIDFGFQQGASGGFCKANWIDSGFQ